MNKMRKLIIAGIIILGAVVAIAYYYYGRIFNPNVPDRLESDILYIPSQGDFQGLMDSLTSRNQILNEFSFEWVAEKMSYTQHIKPGRYKLSPGWSNRELINHLRLGKQEPVQLIINNIRLLSDLFEKLARYLEPDPEQFKNVYLSQNFLDSTGYTSETLLTHFIPNTYELFWNSSPLDVFQRMESEKEKFWNSSQRKQKIDRLGLTTDQAYTLASIVDKESNNSTEKPIIAGVYLNRIRKGIRLQADPTVVFAVKDFGLRRVLNKHLAYDSPYNTYLYSGLPPGPICMPAQSSLEAVINASDHDYIYFCAKPGGNGEHAFASNLTQHNRNARKFHQWLNSQGIR